jgi:hypothetical protein
MGKSYVKPPCERKGCGEARVSGGTPCCKMHGGGKRCKHAFFECRRSRCTSIRCCGCELQRTLMTQESAARSRRTQPAVRSTVSGTEGAGSASTRAVVLLRTPARSTASRTAAAGAAKRMAA